MVLCYVRNLAAEQEEVMKWEQFYSGAWIYNVEGMDVFGMLARDEPFEVKLIVPGMLDNTGTVNDEVFNNEPTFGLIISAIRIDEKKAKLHMTVKTTGTIPKMLLRRMFAYKISLTYFLSF